MRRITAAAVALGTMLTVAGCVPPPTDPPPPVVLAGQSLTSQPPATIVSGECNPAGESTFTVEVSGDATGPYPGTFVETLTVTIGPQTEEHQPGQFRGDITSLESSVEITSPAGNVTATSSLRPASFSKGVCLTSTIANWTIAGQVSAQVEYQATSGASTSSGVGSISFNMYDGNCFCSSNSPQFSHGFQ